MIAVLLAVVLTAAAAGWLVWTVELRRFVRRAGHPDPRAAITAVPAIAVPAHATAVPAPATAVTLPVTIIVPARDEATNLPPLLTSLAALDPAPAQLVVVDDHSTDATAAIAAAHGAEVVTPPPLPADWIGKSWACRRGAAAAHGDLLLFTDADTVHAPHSLRLAVDRLVATDADLVSMVPTHVAVSWWEHLQGAFQLLLVIATRGGRDFAIGQYLLFRRTAYDALGGHDAVRAELAEDLALLRAVRARDERALTATRDERALTATRDARALTATRDARALTATRDQLVLAPGALRVRMYPTGLVAFLRGWRRSFRAGIGAAGLRTSLAVALVCAWLGTLPLVLTAAVVTANLPLAVATTLAWLLTTLDVARRQRLVTDAPAWTAALAPLAVLAFTHCTLAATLDHLRRAPVRWRGRRIDAPRWRA